MGLGGMGVWVAHDKMLWFVLSFVFLWVVMVVVMHAFVRLEALLHVSLVPSTALLGGCEEVFVEGAGGGQADESKETEIACPALEAEERSEIVR